MYIWIKYSKLLTATVFIFLAFFLSAPLVHADVQSELQGGVDTAAGGSGGNAVDKTNNLISTIINLLSVAVGIVAVIMIVVGGYRYITSSGDSGKVSSAKNTLLYAIIGLVIVALAQLIVHFVLAKATSAAIAPTCTNGHWSNTGQPCP